MEDAMKKTMFVALIVALAIGAPGAQSQGKFLDRDTFMDMESVSATSISPDGRQIVFTREWTDQMKDQLRTNLWVVDVDSGRVRELTRGGWRDSAPVWSPDSKRIAFLSDRDGTNQVHTMYVDTGEVAQLTHLSRAASSLKWSPDGKQLAFTQTLPDEEPALKIELPKRPRGAEWAKAPNVVDRISWARDGTGPVEKGFTQVFTLDAIVGGTPRQVTDGKFNHTDPEWSHDGKRIFVSGIRKPDAEYLNGDSEIYEIQLGASPSVKALTDRKGPDANPTLSPNGAWIVYTGSDDKNFTSHLASLYLMDAGGGGKRLLAGGLLSSPGDVTWAADNGGVYYTVGEKGSTVLYFASTKGDVRKVTDGVHMLNSVSIASNGQAAAVRTSPHEPGYVATFSVKGTGPVAAGSMKKLVDVNEDVLAGRTLGAVEEIWYSSKDGLKVQGWIVKPADFQPGKKYPLVLFIHGGPWSMYDVSFNWSFQNFAANGYAVLYTNPRGSTGYGQDFVNGIQFSYPGKDYDDLMAGVDAAVAKGYIDERNMFVCGGSGGGLLTAWIVGHTNRFAAAVAMRPVIDWVSFVGVTDSGGWYRQFAKFPWEDPSDHLRRSPLTYVGNVTTPTMVMTGEADLRTPMGQSEEFYKALKMQKKATLLVRMPDEYHGWRRPSHRLMQQLYLLAWFEKHKHPAATSTQ
jgi:dipeptidyl aminopeptidase/acylaminoacyl peptidase